jgi:hypothetical protein
LSTFIAAMMQRKLATTQKRRAVHVALLVCTLLLLHAPSTRAATYRVPYPPGGLLGMSECKITTDCPLHHFCNERKCYPRALDGAACCAHDGCTIGFCEVGGNGGAYDPNNLPQAYGMEAQVCVCVLRVCCVCVCVCLLWLCVLACLASLASLASLRFRLLRLAFVRV